MTWVRQGQSGLEFNDINELSEKTTYGNTSSTVFSTIAKTGTYSCRIGITSTVVSRYSRGFGISSSTSVRASCFLNHEGVQTSSDREGIIFVVDSGTDSYITYKGSTSDLKLYVKGTLQQTVSAATYGFTTTGTWFHCACVFYSHTSSGFFSFYLNGTKILTFTGNTGSGSDITGLYVGGDKDATAGWLGNSAFDDLYVDYSTSSESDLPPSNITFELVNVIADNGTQQWSTNGSASHYANVDEIPPNGDTDYNYVTSASLVDRLTLADYNAPSGYSIAAVIPTIYVQKQLSSSTPTVDIGLHDGTNSSYSSAKTPSTAYGYLFERFTLTPSSTAWDNTNIDSTDILLRSSGTF